MPAGGNRLGLRAVPVENDTAGADDFPIAVTLAYERGVLVDTDERLRCR